MTALRKYANADRTAEIEAGASSTGLTIGELAQFVESCREIGIPDETRFEAVTITRSDFPSGVKLIRAHLWERLSPPQAGQVAAFVAGEES